MLVFISYCEKVSFVAFVKHHSMDLCMGKLRYIASLYNVWH